MSLFLLWSLQLSLSLVKDPCDYTGPTQMILADQQTYSICSLKSSLLCNNIFIGFVNWDIIILLCCYTYLLFVCVCQRKTYWSWLFLLLGVCSPFLPRGLSGLVVNAFIHQAVSSVSKQTSSRVLLTCLSHCPSEQQYKCPPTKVHPTVSLHTNIP